MQSEQNDASNSSTVSNGNITSNSNDDIPLTDTAEISTMPSTRIIAMTAVMLMSAGATKLGLDADHPAESPNFDLDEARRVITALAGLVSASAEYLGPHAAHFRDGLQALQQAFREASPYPDPAGEGPGEKFTGPVW